MTSTEIPPPRTPVGRPRSGLAAAARAVSASLLPLALLFAAAYGALALAGSGRLGARAEAFTVL
ncbi:hypothetical protein, partial [Streptomyces mayteni]